MFAEGQAAGHMRTTKPDSLAAQLDAISSINQEMEQKGGVKRPSRKLPPIYQRNELIGWWQSARIDESAFTRVSAVRRVSTHTLFVCVKMLYF